MYRPVPLVRDLVLLGGGHAHALVLRSWGMKPVPGARLTVINPAPTAPYTGMLPGHVAGHYDRDALEIDLVRLARFAGARIILGTADGIDRDARTVSVPGRPPIRYDILSVDIGITSDMPEIDGFAEHGVAAKPLGRFADRWAAFRTDARSGTPAEIALIGAGVAGAELALAMHHALTTDGVEAPRITLVDAGEPMAGLRPGTRNRVLAALTAARIGLKAGRKVAHVAADHVTLDDGTSVPARLTVGAAGARPHKWLEETGLDLTDGYITVDRWLRSVSNPDIYAAGDCAHFTPDPRPKAGVYAVRAAPVLAANFRADLTGRQRRIFQPQGDFLKLISLGRQSAVADKWGLATEGPLLWQLKDRIDRKFMDRLNQPPAMPAPKAPADAATGVQAKMAGAPLCGGCGAKVGSDPLAAALAALPAPTRADHLSVPGDDAAILRTGGTTQVITTDHLRALTLDPFLMGRIAAVHALGDIRAMGARPQTALASITLPEMAEPMQAATLREILAAAHAVFAAAGAEISGGHTTLGAEMSIGFTVTGLIERDPIRVSGALPGDALILTKPLGSGVLLAGEMALKAEGPDIAALFEAMQRDQGDAADILSGAHAMTDVTGFGLAGHLMAICRASGTGAELSLAAVPAYTGAVDLAASGVRSSLYPANRAALPSVETPDDPRADLLFDPQTCGGLLAAVAADEAEALITNLSKAGYPAACIGTVTDAAGTITLRL